MIPEWVYDLSMMQLLVFTVGLFLMITLGMLVLIRRYGRRWHFENATDFGEIFYDAIGNIFALLLAFITVLAWQNYNDACDSVAAEANAINIVYRNAEAYPEPVRDQIQQLLHEYVLAVRDSEWPKLAHNQLDVGAHRKLTALGRLIETMEPSTSGQQVVMSEMLRQLSNLRNCRSQRLEDSLSNLQTPLWLVMIIGTFIFLFYAALFRIENARTHMFMTSSLAVILGLVFFLLIAYDRCFGTAMCIDTTAFDLLLEGWKVS